MKKTLLLLSSLFALSGSVFYSPTTLAMEAVQHEENGAIEAIEGVYITDDAKYTFIRRGFANLPEESQNDKLVFWIFDVENTSDEPLRVRFNTMLDLQIKLEDENTIVDIDNDDLFHVEMTGENSFVELDTKLGNLELKPGGTVTLLYQGLYSSEENKDVYLEFSEIFNSENNGIIRPQGYEESGEE